MSLKASEIQALRDFARLIGDPDLAARTEVVIAREEAISNAAFEPWRERLRGKRVLRYTGGVKSWSIVSQRLRTKAFWKLLRFLVFCSNHSSIFFCEVNNLNTVEEVTIYTKAGGGCAACHEGIEEILAKVMSERAGPGEVSPPLACPATPDAPNPPSTKLTLVQKIKKIEEVPESVRPMLQRDHGDVDLADVQGNKIYVHLKGTCSGCMMEAATLGGIQQKMIEALGELVQVCRFRTCQLKLDGFLLPLPRGRPGGGWVSPFGHPADGGFDLLDGSWYFARFDDHVAARGVDFVG